MTGKRQIDPHVRKRLDDIGEGVVRAKLPWIMNVTSLQHASVEGAGEPLGDGLNAPLWAIEQWLAEKEACRQRLGKSRGNPRRARRGGCSPGLVLPDCPGYDGPFPTFSRLQRGAEFFKTA
jgi:hypothetical protein